MSAIIGQNAYKRVAQILGLPDGVLSLSLEFKRDEVMTAKIEMVVLEEQLSKIEEIIKEYKLEKKDA